MRLEGFIGKPILSRGNRSMMNYFVNGRYIKSPILANATMQGYQGFLMGHRYPFVVLMLSIDSSFIDVNVHPTKMEIRFTNQMEVLSLVRDTVTAVSYTHLDVYKRQASRDEISYEQTKEYCKQLSERLDGDFRPLKIPAMSISSHEIRKRIKKGKSIIGYCPEPVVRYIQMHRLYGDSSFVIPRCV